MRNTVQKAGTQGEKKHKEENGFESVTKVINHYNGSLTSKAPTWKQRKEQR